jgi:hypothetical protein
VFVSNVTAPLSASALPATVVPVTSVTLANATMFPLKRVAVPSVAELPTCQNALHGLPPLITVTEAGAAPSGPVVSVLPI